MGVLVDRTSMNAFCQLHEIYVEERKMHTDKAVYPSRVPEKRESRERGKEKVPAFRLASDIEQQGIQRADPG